MNATKCTASEASEKTTALQPRGPLVHFNHFTTDEFGTAHERFSFAYTATIATSLSFH